MYELFFVVQDTVSNQLHRLHEWESGNLMSFDKVSGKLETHFGEGIVNLMKEVNKAPFLLYTRLQGRASLCIGNK